MTIDLAATLAATQKRVDAESAAKASGSGDFINHQQLPIGTHTIRIFADPNGALFQPWDTTWAGQHRKQADPRGFEECDPSIKARIDAVLAATVIGKDGKEQQALPYKNGFWHAEHFYAFVYETSAEGDWWKAGKMYVVSAKWFVRNAILSALTEFAEDFGDKLTDSIDINKEGIPLTLTVEAKAANCFPKVGKKLMAAPAESVKMSQFVPLTSLWTYNAEIASDIAEQMESKLKEAMDRRTDATAAQTPPAEDDAPAAPAPAPAEETAAKAPAGNDATAADEDDDDPF